MAASHELIICFNPYHLVQPEAFQAIFLIPLRGRTSKTAIRHLFRYYKYFHLDVFTSSVKFPGSFVSL